jgi:hypothetical protein
MKYILCWGAKCVFYSAVKYVHTVEDCLSGGLKHWKHPNNETALRILSMSMHFLNYAIVMTAIFMLNKSF